MFTFDHKRDFEAVLAATEPFALVRFGDGEAALLTGKAHKAANGEWSVGTAGSWITPALRESLARVADGYCVGLPPGCCLPAHVKLHHEARVPVASRTFATLFLHGNLERTPELIEALQPVFVGRLGSIMVPDRGVEAPCDLDGIVEQMLAVERPMLVSAGPLANVLIDRYWQQQAPERRQIVLDVGSALDRALSGKSSRHYHQGWTLGHHCTLAGPPVGLVHPQAAKSIVTTGTAPAAPTGAPKRMGNTPVIVGRKGTPMQKRASRTPLVIHDGRRHGMTAPVIAGVPAAAPAVAAAPAPGAPTVVARPQKRRGRCANCTKVIRSRR